jgi:drug/metabolite transporter (DMT)-like permease
MAAALSGAAGGILVKKVSARISPFFLTGGQMFIGSCLLLAAGLSLSPSSDLVLTRDGIILFFYTAFLSAAAFVLWNYLLKYNRAGEISLYLFAIPLFGTLLSRLFLKETLTAGLFLALLLVSAGILMVNLNSLRQKPKI